MKKYYTFLLFILCSTNIIAQLKWRLVDSLQKNLPIGLKIYSTIDSIDGKPNIAYYVEADLNNKHLKFDVDTTFKRRLTPTEFFEKNNNPYLVVNGTFFNFKTNQNLNTVIKNGKAISFNIAYSKGNGKDSLQNIKMYRSALGIYKNRKADIAWVQSDTAKKLKASQIVIEPSANDTSNLIKINSSFKKWNVQTAIGGGPVLIQNGAVCIANNEELLFTGKGRYERNPRTAMGYTKNGKLIILVIQGRFAGKAEGADLVQEATILKDIGCVEALNLDGGGSSCMLVNGKQTINPSDKTGQRAVPAVFIITKN